MAQDFEQAIIPGAAGFREVTFFHRPSRTLLLTDLVVNLEAGKLPLHARAFAWATGVLAPDGKAPAYLRFIVKRRAAPLPRARPRAGSWRSTPSGSSSRTDAGSSATAPRSCGDHSAGFCADRARKWRGGKSDPLAFPDAVPCQHKVLACS